MINFYSWSTPNGRKIAILLEELSIDYTVFPINIDKNSRIRNSFKKKFPIDKIPCIIDTENNQTIFESGAILLYLSKKYNKFFIKSKKWETYSWLMYQMSTVGPLLGQAHQFLYYNRGKSKFAEKKFRNYVKEIYENIEKRLESKKYIIDDYSIVDMAIWPWIARYERQQINIHQFPNILQWFKIIAKRPAVIKGYNIVGNKEIIPFS